MFYSPRVDRFPTDKRTLQRIPKANPILRYDPRKLLRHFYFGTPVVRACAQYATFALHSCYKPDVLARDQPAATVDLGVGSHVTMRVPRSASHQARNPALSAATANPAKASGLNAVDLP